MYKPSSKDPNDDLPRDEVDELLWRFLQDACTYIACQVSEDIPVTVSEMATLISREIQWDLDEVKHLLAAMKTGW